MHHALDVHNKHRNKNAKPSKGGLTLTHQCAEKYKAKVFPRMISSPQTLPDLLKNSFPISSDSGFGRHGKSLPSGSSPTIDRPSVVITPPLGSKITRDGIPRTLNLVLNDDFLSLDTKGNEHHSKLVSIFGLILGTGTPGSKYCLVASGREGHQHETERVTYSSEHDTSLSF